MMTDRTSLHPATVDTEPSSAPGPVPGELRIAAEALFWARLDGVPKRPSAYALDAALERWIPTPIEEVVARYALVKPGSWIACGIRRNDLEQAITDAESLGAPVESIRPHEIPGFLQNDTDGEAQAFERALVALEFRSGRFTSPRTMRRRRHKLAVLAAAFALTCAGLTAALLAEARSSRASTALARHAVASIAERALGPARGATATMDPSLRLAAALRSAEATRSQSLGAVRPHDRVAAYTELLASWPSEPLTQAQEVRIEQTQLVVRTRLRSAADAETLVLALDAALPNWELRSHGVNKGRDAFESAAVFAPTKKASQP